MQIASYVFLSVFRWHFSRSLFPSITTKVSGSSFLIGDIIRIGSDFFSQQNSHIIFPPHIQILPIFQNSEGKSVPSDGRNLWPDKKYTQGLAGEKRLKRNLAML